MTPLLPQLLDKVLPLNESREKSFPFNVNYVFLDNDENYTFVYIHSVLAAYITIANIIAIDFIFIATVQHACGMFRLLG